MSESKAAQRVRQILAEVKKLATEYYQLTGKPRLFIWLTYASWILLIVHRSSSF